MLLEHLLGDLVVLGLNGGLLRVAGGVADSQTPVQIDLVLTVLHILFDLRRDLAADNSPDVSHQALGFAQIAALDGLRHGEKGVMHFIVQVLRP